MFKYVKRFFIPVFLLVLLGFVYGNYKGWTLESVKTDFKQEQKQQKTDQGKQSMKKKNHTSGQTKEKDIKQDVANTESAPGNTYLSLDRYARNTPKSAASTIETLAIYLQQRADNDLEKARAIYVWITDHIRYNDKAYNSRQYGDNSAEAVLRTRTAVCEGFSNLFLALGEHMDLKVKKVPGFAKGLGYYYGKSFGKADHAWNIAEINGQWKVFDSTWGQGIGKNVQGKLVTSKRFDDYWFNLDPYEAIFNHFPEDRSLAFVSPSMNLTKYAKLPVIDHAYFKLGFDARSTYKQAYKNRTIQYPKCRQVDTYIAMKDAPSTKYLQANKTYFFDFVIPKALQVAIRDANEDWTFFEGKNGRFQLSYIPQQTGRLDVFVKYKKGGKSFHSAMEYEVGKGKSI